MSQKSPKERVTSGIVGYRAFLIISVLLLLAASVVNILAGAVAISPREMLQLIIPGGILEDGRRTILLQVRFPRSILAGLVGSSLAIAGAAFQGLFRNPLAGPYVLGVSSGASFGAVLAMVLGLHAGALGFGTVPVMAFAGALLSMFFVYNLARRNGGIDVTTMLLGGIAISAIFSALINLCLTFANERVIGSAVFWMMGGLSGANWRRIYFVSFSFAVGMGTMWVLTNALNAFLLGEEDAYNLGINIDTLKKIVLVGASLLTAAAVAASGAIGFVGLITPHIVRIFVGPNHRRLIPGVALVGASFLMLADAAARTLLAPAELQVGIITALLGGPFFLYILKKHRKTE